MRPCLGRKSRRSIFVIKAHQTKASRLEVLKRALGIYRLLVTITRSANNLPGFGEGFGAIVRFDAEIESTATGFKGKR